MEPKRITSLSNPAVKAAAKLKQPRASKEAGCFIVEGARSVEELTGDWETESLWVSDTFLGAESCLGLGDRPEAPASAFCHTPDSILNAIAGTQSPQGILAVVRRRYFTLQDVLEHQSTTPLLVILEDLQDPGMRERFCARRTRRGRMASSVQRRQSISITRKWFGHPWGLCFIFPSTWRKTFRKR